MELFIQQILDSDTFPSTILFLIIIRGKIFAWTSGILASELKSVASGSKILFGFNQWSDKYYKDSE